MSLKLIMPLNDLKIIKTFSQLEENLQNKIIDEFKKILPETIDDLVIQLSKEIEISQFDLTKFVGFSISFYYNYYNYGELKEDYIEETVKGSIDHYNFDLELNERTKTLLTAILNMDESIGILAKMSVLNKDNPINFINARIITDLRNIYHSDTPKISNYAIIKHTIKFNVMQEKKRKEYYFSLNLKELIELKEVIERAIKKDKSLSIECKKKGIKIIGVDIKYE